MEFYAAERKKELIPFATTSYVLIEVAEWILMYLKVNLLCLLLVLWRNFIKEISWESNFILLFHVCLAGFKVILEKRW